MEANCGKCYDSKRRTFCFGVCKTDQKNKKLINVWIHNQKLRLLRFLLLSPSLRLLGCLRPLRLVRHVQKNATPRDFQMSVKSNPLWRIILMKTMRIRKVRLCHLGILPKVPVLASQDFMQTVRQKPLPSCALFRVRTSLVFREKLRVAIRPEKHFATH